MIRLTFNPLVRGAWVGGSLMALGGLFAMWPQVHRALVVLRADDAANAPPRVIVTDDDVEAAIRRARESQKSCATCGPRPEPDALYCSQCGVRLREV